MLASLILYEYIDKIFFETGVAEAALKLTL